MIEAGPVDREEELQTASEHFGAPGRAERRQWGVNETTRSSSAQACLAADYIPPLRMRAREEHSCLRVSTLTGVDSLPPRG
jgi:hypothetical protein